MSNGPYLTNQLLIAMPAMGDPNFSQTVALICEHSAQGALGIVLNRPLPMLMPFFRDGAKAFETPPVVVKGGMPNRLKTAPLKFSVPLTGFAAGEYVCQVTVLDPTSKKAAFWQGPLAVVE